MIKEKNAKKNRYNIEEYEQIITLFDMYYLCYPSIIN
jgi:hypothetical protein